MIRRRVYGPLAALTAVAALAGCAQTVQGHPSAPSVDLGTRLQHGMDAVTSAHLRTHVSSPGVEVQAAGDQALANGVATAFDLTEHVAGVGAIRILEVHNTVYVRLPARFDPTDKPWVRVKPNTTDPVFAPLARMLSAIQNSASLRQYTTLARVATDIKDLGKASIGGVATEHYSYGVLVDRLPASFPGVSTLGAAGVHRIPVQMWLDGKDRLVKLLETVDVAGAHTATTVTLTDFDKPVAITAPPPGQVATR